MLFHSTALMLAKVSLSSVAFAGSLLFHLTYGASSIITTPRGVGPEFIKRYLPRGENFTCLTDSSNVLPFDALNDDYCDCPDGSDEPGTAACAHLPVEKLALPGFYCSNNGHVPAYLPFSAVNDGVCNYDLCCDGSDEWAEADGLCQDKCQEIGDKWKRKERERILSLDAAMKARTALVNLSSRIRQDLARRIYEKEKELSDEKANVQALENKLKQAELAERENGIAQSDLNQKISEFSSSMMKQGKEAKYLINRLQAEKKILYTSITELEDILSRLQSDYNPNFNDEGVKSAIKAWENYAAQAQEIVQQNESPQSDTESLSHENDILSSLEAFQDFVTAYTASTNCPNLFSTRIHGYLDKARSFLKLSGLLSRKGAQPSESRAVSKARADLNLARSSLDRIQADYQTLKRDLEVDYGSDDIFRALKDRCVSRDTGEYTYEVCFYGRTTQKPNRGGSAVSMGSFVRLEQMPIDESSVFSFGSSLDKVDNIRTILRYENGQHCWNGPNRSSIVILVCSDLEELRLVTEEEVCVYRLVVGTPAVCTASEEKLSGEMKSEL